MLEQYVCPVCQSRLDVDSSAEGVCHLTCAGCNEAYEFLDGVPCFIPQRAYEQYPIRRVKEIYDRAYKHADIMGTKVDPEYSRITKSTLVAFCGDAANGCLLDIGAGDGDLWEWVPNGYRGHAIDISESGVKRTVQRFPTLNAAVAIAEWLPYPDGYFSAVIAADTLEHTFDLTQTLATVKRILKPEGVLAFSVPAPDSLRKWGYNQFLTGIPSLAMCLRLIRVLLQRTFLFGKPDFQPIDRDISLEGWQRHLQKAGFEVVRIKEWPESPLKPIVYLFAVKAAA